MLLLVFNWLVFAVAGALYLLRRLPHDWSQARHRVAVRYCMMQFTQAIRLSQRDWARQLARRYPDPRDQVRWEDVN